MYTLTGLLLLASKKYFTADIGISGANAVAADTGQITIIENEGKQQLVYKHAISTISPATNITIMQPEKKEF